MWVRDHADTEDLSVQTEASSVYTESGRTLEHELGNGSMSSNVVTIDSGMEKVVEGTYDGVYESCKMYGKSLVNVMTKVIDATWNLNLTNWSIKTTSPSDLILKPNTMYSVIVYVTEKTCPDRDDLFWVGDVDGSKNKVTHDIVRKNVSLGTNVFVINTVSDFSNLPSTKGGIGFQGSKFVEGTLKWKVIVLEGDWTDKELPPYFTGLCDVKAPILKNVGKNLWDNKIFESCPIATLNGDGSVTLNGTLQNHWMFNYTIDKGTYTSSAIGDDNGYIHLFWGGEDEFFQRTSPFTISEKVTRQGYITRGTYNRVDIKLQLEEGSIITTYEPYKTNILTTPEQVVLRKVGDVCDSYDALTGEYVQRVGEVVFDGSEGINLVDSVSNSTYLYFDFKGEFTGAKNDSFAICDRFTYVKGLYGDYQNVEGVAVGENGWGSIRILASKLATPDVIGFKQWLSQNPVTAQYELEVPIITTIEPSTIPFVYENGHIILESGHEGQSLLPTLEYQTVVSRSGQVAMIDKTIQQHERKITLLEKMLVQNIIDIEYKNTLLALKLEMDEVI